MSSKTPCGLSFTTNSCHSVRSNLFPPQLSETEEEKCSSNTNNKKKSKISFFALLSLQIAVTTYRQLCCCSMGTLCRLEIGTRGSWFCSEENLNRPSSCQLKLANLIPLSAWSLHRDDWSLPLAHFAHSNPVLIPSLTSDILSSRLNLTHHYREHWGPKADAGAMESLQVPELFSLLSKRGKLNQWCWG